MNNKYSEEELSCLRLNLFRLTGKEYDIQEAVKIQEALTDGFNIRMNFNLDRLSWLLHDHKGV